MSSNGGGNLRIDIRAGRNEFLVSRGFVSFELSSLPQGVQVQEATLRLYQTKVEGNPYGNLGSLKVDHLNFGDSLEDADYATPAILSSFATVSSKALIEWKDMNVTREVKDDLSVGRSRSEFRIHFTTEVTGATSDFAYFESAENTEGTGNTPQLVVKYY